MAELVVIDFNGKRMMVYDGFLSGSCMFLDFVSTLHLDLFSQISVM